MTYSEREEIFSKEALNLDDIVKLFGISKSAASGKVAQMKRQLGKDRLGMIGKIHVLDYLEWLDIQEEMHMDRYKKADNEHSIDRTGFFSQGRFL